MIDIVQVADKLGIVMQDRGKYKVCDCPACGAKHTMFLDPERQICKCFHCNTSGSAVLLVMTVKGIGYREATEWLQALEVITSK